MKIKNLLIRVRKLEGDQVTAHVMQLGSANKIVYGDNLLPLTWACVDTVQYELEPKMRMLAEKVTFIFDTHNMVVDFDRKHVTVVDHENISTDAGLQRLFNSLLESRAA